MWEEPFDEIRKFQKEMNKLFENFFERPSIKLLKEEGKSIIKKPLQLIKEPLTNIEEKDNKLIARIDIPGVDKKDIKLKVTEDYIEIKAESKSEKKVKKKGFLKEEKGYRSYYRIIPLPKQVEAEEAKASYENGVLEIKIPKKTKAEKKIAKEIKIQ